MSGAKWLVKEECGINTFDRAHGQTLELETFIMFEYANKSMRNEKLYYAETNKLSVNLIKFV